MSKLISINLLGMAKFEVKHDCESVTVGLKVWRVKIGIVLGCGSKTDGYQRATYVSCNPFLFWKTKNENNE